MAKGIHTSYVAPNGTRWDYSSDDKKWRPLSEVAPSGPLSKIKQYPNGVLNITLPDNGFRSATWSAVAEETNPNIYTKSVYSGKTGVLRVKRSVSTAINVTVTYEDGSTGTGRFEPLTMSANSSYSGTTWPTAGTATTIYEGLLSPKDMTGTMEWWQVGGPDITGQNKTMPNLIQSYPQSVQANVAQNKVGITVTTPASTTNETYQIQSIYKRADGVDYYRFENLVQAMGSVEGVMPAGDQARAPFTGYLDKPIDKFPLWTSTTDTTFQDKARAWLVAAMKQNGTGLWANTYQYGISYVVAKQTDPVYRIEWANDRDWNFQLPGWYGTDVGTVPLQDKIFVDVPIPTWACGAAGSDGALCIYIPWQNRVVELWKTRRLPRVAGKPVWSAESGGTFPTGTIGAAPFGYTVSASGLSCAAMMLGIDEARDAVNAIKSGQSSRGIIKHPLYCAIANPASTPSWPAVHSDGTDSTAHAIGEGQRFSIDPALDLSTLGLNPFEMALCTVLQEYGGFLGDRTSYNAVITCEAPDMIDRRDGGSAWSKIMNGASNTVTAKIPDSAWRVHTRFANKAAFDTAMNA